MNLLFQNVSILILIATAFAIILRQLKQPLILAYILAGVVAGPLGFKIITSPDLIQSLSSFGIAFLLFLVGLELNLKQLRSLGRSALFIGLGQMLFTVLISYLTLFAFKIPYIPALYISLALAFSSTIIVVKLLAEKKEIDSLHGRLSISLLLLQDALAIMALITVSSLSNSGNLPMLSILVALAKGACIAAASLLLGRFALAKLFSYIAHSGELLFLTSLAWCFLVSLATYALGLSIEIGAFLAGLALASTPYNLEISARIKSLRDFFVTLFFIVLGSQFTFAGLGNLQPLFWIFVVLVAVANPLIVLSLMSLLGFKKRTSFFVGQNFGMISEFSFVLVGLGLALGHVSSQLMALVVAVGVVTITVSTYSITHGESLYRFLLPYLGWFERRHSPIAESPLTQLSGHVVLVGYHRLGERIASTLQDLNKTTLIIDFNPDAIRKLNAQGKLCLYGDMGDIEIIERARVAEASMVISTNPDAHDNLLLIKNLRERGLKTPVYVTANSWHDCNELYKHGADYVIFPHYLSAQHFSLILREVAINRDRILVDKQKHLRELELRYAINTQ